MADRCVDSVPVVAVLTAGCLVRVRDPEGELAWMLLADETDALVAAKTVAFVLDGDDTRIKTVARPGARGPGKVYTLDAIRPKANLLRWLDGKPETNEDDDA